MLETNNKLFNEISFTYFYSQTNQLWVSKSLQFAPLSGKLILNKLVKVDLKHQEKLDN